MSLGALPHDTLIHISKDCLRIPVIVSCILAKDSINVCNTITRIPISLTHIGF